MFKQKRKKMHSRTWETSGRSDQSVQLFKVFAVRKNITKTRLFKYNVYRKFLLQKFKILRYKNCDIFHISARNIDCGYSLEPPGRGGSNEYPQSMF